MWMHQLVIYSKDEINAISSNHIKIRKMLQSLKLLKELYELCL